MLLTARSSSLRPCILRRRPLALPYHVPKRPLVQGLVRQLLSSKYTAPPCRERILPEAWVERWLTFEVYIYRLFYHRRVSALPMTQTMERTLLTSEGVKGKYTLHHRQQF